jgi:hypothetical protein
MSHRALARSPTLSRVSEPLNHVIRLSFSSTRSLCKPSACVVNRWLEGVLVFTLRFSLRLCDGGVPPLQDIINTLV